MRLRTVRGYDFGEVSSAMQKALRRGDAKLAGYWAIELWSSGYVNLRAKPATNLRVKTSHL